MTPPPSIELEHSVLRSLEDLRPRLILDPRYATANNFTGEVLYTDPALKLIPEAFSALQRASVAAAQQELIIVVWDAFRPAMVQAKLWAALPDPRYVTPPEVGSPHTRGCAVDVTLADRQGHPLPMPSAFDEFGEAAHADFDDLPDQVRRNRAMLADLMYAGGWESLATEWWHFHLPDWRDRPFVADL